jgi:hypothetical protein
MIRTLLTLVRQTLDLLAALRGATAAIELGRQPAAADLARLGINARDFRRIHLTVSH